MPRRKAERASPFASGEGLVGSRPGRSVILLRRLAPTTRASSRNPTDLGSLPPPEEQATNASIPTVFSSDDGQVRTAIGSTQTYPHVSVMRDELIAQLAPKSGGLYVDLTTGAGGHLEAILEASSPDGRCIGIDRDSEALDIARARLTRFAHRVTLLHGNADDVTDLIDRTLGSRWAQVDGVILDAGVSSMQLDQPVRGFSFRQNGPLDMRMDRSQGMTAADIVNGLTEADLAALIDQFGEERYARRVAAAIVSRRASRAFTTTGELADVIARAIPTVRKSKGSRGLPEAIHPATRTFQAIRIAVNRELDALRRALLAAIDLTAPGGRIVVIAFHSLEDRIVKQVFARAAGKCTCPHGLPVCACGATATVRNMTPRPLVPSEAEIAANPRSRSARMRSVEVLRPRSR
jgi:16S rRNA (cytosine1402-N4)-methyltransferase